MYVHSVSETEKKLLLPHVTLVCSKNLTCRLVSLYQVYKIRIFCRSQYKLSSPGILHGRCVKTQTMNEVVRSFRSHFQDLCSIHRGEVFEGWLSCGSLVPCNVGIELRNVPMCLQEAVVIPLYT